MFISVFNNYLNKGMNLCKQYNYRYLEHKFNKLVNQGLEYDEKLAYDQFQDIDNRTLDLFVEQYISKKKKDF